MKFWINKKTYLGEIYGFSKVMTFILVGFLDLLEIIRRCLFGFAIELGNVFFCGFKDPLAL